MEGETVVFQCLEIEQPIGTFYVAVGHASDIMSISFADVRRLAARDVEEYIGIQRPLSKERVKEIKQYVTNVDASFPTGIILALDSRFAVFNDETKEMTVDKRGDAALILDGQHRIAGLEGFPKVFQLPVILFIDMDMEDKAMTFATINLKQTKVNKSLAYDLFEFSNSRSPQRTMHDIAKVLNRTSPSPFNKKIKVLGLATGGLGQTLTQAAFVEKLMSFITDNAMRDRNTYKEGNEPELVFKGFDERKYIFRRLFLAEKDLQLAGIVLDFFTEVEARWGDAWRDPPRGIMLGRTNGFAALCDVLRLMWNREGWLEGVDRGTVRERLASVRLEGADFTTDRYQPGTSGQAQMYQDFARMMYPSG